MSRTSEEILALYQARQARLAPEHKAALQVRAAYYGDITLPLPEIDRNEKPLVANLLFSAGEQKAMRIASTMPDVYYPSTRPGFKLHDQQARDRKAVNLAWWDCDRLKLKMRKRARHMVYYAASPVMLRPDLKEHRPSWKVRNPLTALTPDLDVGDLTPDDVIFTYTKPYAWLARRYRDKMALFGDPEKVADGTFTLLEYQDADDNALLVVGTKVEASGPGYAPTTTKVDVCVELERTKNRVGRCTCVLAGGIGIDHARGSFDGTIGMWQAMGKLMALEVIGMQRSIWPEQWLIDDPNRNGAEIVTIADPLAGVTGHVTGGTLQTVTPQINQGGMNLINVMERGTRIEAGIPAELGGESTSNIRTGRRGDQILSSVLDFPLQEHQEILAVALQEENKIAIAIDKAYFPTSKSVYLSGSGGEITYDPTELFETDTHFVKYSHAGVDAQGLIVEAGQRIGIGSLSIRSFMEMDPLIEDPQGEFDRITLEQLRKALLTGLEQMAQDPQMAPIVAEATMKVRAAGVEVEDAVLQVHQAIQEMQAQQAQAQQQVAPGAPPGPEAQPGMAQPSIAAPPQGLGNLQALLGQLKGAA